MLYVRFEFLRVNGGWFFEWLSWEDDGGGAGVRGRVVITSWLMIYDSDKKMKGWEDQMLAC